MAGSPLIYPVKTFSSKDSKYNDGGQFITEHVDYLRFASISTVGWSANQNSYATGGARSNNLNTDEVVYLYAPQSINASYSVSYNQVELNAIGAAAVGMINKDATSESIAAQLQQAAGAGMPEMAFNTMSQALSGVAGALGLNSGPDAQALSALSTGQVLNPYMEQVFQAPSFRSHQFDFKLIARNADEARVITSIIKFFKKNMLPSFSSGSRANSVLGSQGGADGALNQSRWLQVPNRFSIEFVRQKSTDSGIVTSAKGTQNLNIFKFKDCILDNLSVNYTPDGQYVALKDGNIPAIQIQLSFKETAIVTSADVESGF